MKTYFRAVFLTLLVLFMLLLTGVLFAQTPIVFASAGVITLTASADGAQPMTYQWYRNDVLVVGATSSKLLITDPKATGSFYCVIKNEFGSAKTSKVQLANTTVGSAEVKITRKQ